LTPPCTQRLNVHLFFTAYFLKHEGFCGAVRAAAAAAAAAAMLFKSAEVSSV
jgi:pantothenate kinase